MHYRMIFRSTEPDAEADFGHIHGYIHVDAEGGYPKALSAYEFGNPSRPHFIMTAPELYWIPV